MSTEYFTATGNPATAASGASATIRSEFASIEAGFAKLPAMSTNATKMLRVNAGGTAIEATAILTAITFTNEAHTDQTLTDAATISWNMDLGGLATVTLGGNRTMAAPTNLKKAVYILHIIQDGTGTRTITWDALFKWTAATAPVLSVVGGRRDIISFICDGTNMYGSYLPDVR